MWATQSCQCKRLALLTLQARNWDHPGIRGHYIWTLIGLLTENLHLKSADQKVWISEPQAFADIQKRYREKPTTFWRGLCRAKEYLVYQIKIYYLLPCMILSDWKQIYKMREKNLGQPDKLDCELVPTRRNLGLEQLLLAHRLSDTHFFDLDKCKNVHIQFWKWNSTAIF